MLGETELEAGPAGSLAPFERSGKRATRVEDQEITRPPLLLST